MNTTTRRYGGKMKLKIVKQFAPQVQETQVFDLDDPKLTFTLINDDQEMDLNEFIESAEMIAERMTDYIEQEEADDWADNGFDDGEE